MGSFGPAHAPSVRMPRPLSRACEGPHATAASSALPALSAARWSRRRLRAVPGAGSASPSGRRGCCGAPCTPWPATARDPGTGLTNLTNLTHSPKWPIMRARARAREWGVSQSPSGASVRQGLPIRGARRGEGVRPGAREPAHAPDGLGGRSVRSVRTGALPALGGPRLHDGCRTGPLQCGWLARVGRAQAPSRR